MPKKTIKGENTDQILLKVIRDYPGLSQYELGKKIKWTIGRVDGAVRRLLNSKEVYVTVIERNGRRVNLVYPKDQKPSDVIEVRESLLKTTNPSTRSLWQEEAFIYALDNVTIGISGCEIPDWSEAACFNSRIPIERSDDGKVSLRIPERFVNFYNLERKHRVAFLNGNNILVTVSGDIIETKNYPS